jgi:hypothetical protein
VKNGILTTPIVFVDPVLVTALKDCGLDASESFPVSRETGVHFWRFTLGNLLLALTHTASFVSDDSLVKRAVVFLIDLALANEWWDAPDVSSPCEDFGSMARMFWYQP